MAWFGKQSTNITKLHDTVCSLLADFKDPLLCEPISKLGWMGKLLPDAQGKTAKPQYKLQFNWGYPLSNSQIDTITQQLQQKITSAKLSVDIKVSIIIDIKNRAPQQAGQKTVANVKNLIAIASGKGGVGKSTTATHLAYALSEMQVKTGLLDADIYGPNQPHLLGAVMPKPQAKQKKFIPVEVHGIQSMSIGYLLDQTTPLIWRGPMVSGALQQLLNDTLWQPLDYLIIDMPPGTGDIQLTLAKKYPLSGAIIVTTPHALALQDARRAIEMFLKVKVPILGVIENMSEYECEHCHKKNKPFGDGGAKSLAAEYNIPLLAEILLSKVLADPLTASASQQNNHADMDINNLRDIYFNAAQMALAKLSMQKVNYSSKFAQVVVE